MIVGAVSGGVLGGATSGHLMPFLRGKESFLGKLKDTSNIGNSLNINPKNHSPYEEYHVKIKNTYNTDGIYSTTEYETDLTPTIDRIKSGIKYSHRNDGIVFQNREGLLPKKPLGYYREYVHPTSGINHAGLQRVVVGSDGDIHYSPNHYKNFYRIK